MLFSIYFLFYVLSPFCFTNDGLSEGGESTYQLNFNMKNLRVVWGLFLSAPDKQRDPGAGGYDVQVLIRKARALVTTNSIVKFAPSDSAEFVFSEIDFSPQGCTSSARYSTGEHPAGPCLRVSGLSPPYFS